MMSRHRRQLLQAQELINRNYFDIMDNTKTPNLTELTATILSGLLASGDYTEGVEHFTPYTGEDRRLPRPHYRREALQDAIQLAKLLIEHTAGLSTRPQAPQPVPE